MNVHPDQWSHCPGRSNPADLPSRGLTALEVSVNQLWRRGPDWLYTGLEPRVDAEPLSMPEECSLELKAKAVPLLTLVTLSSRCPISNLIDCKKFSSLSKLLRVTAQVLRAVKKFKSLKSHQPDPQPATTLKQVTEAEVLWVRDAQLLLTCGKDFDVQRRQFNLF